MLSKLEGFEKNDPLFPYRFVIGMEAFSCLLTRAVEGKYLFGCKIAYRGGQELIISHLLYVDDALMFCDANKDNGNL